MNSLYDSLLGDNDPSLFFKFCSRCLFFVYLNLHSKNDFLHRYSVILDTEIVSIKIVNKVFFYSYIQSYHFDVICIEAQQRCTCNAQQILSRACVIRQKIKYSVLIYGSVRVCLVVSFIVMFQYELLILSM